MSQRDILRSSEVESDSVVVKVTRMLVLHGTSRYYQHYGLSVALYCVHNTSNINVLLDVLLLLGHIEIHLSVRL